VVLHDNDLALISAQRQRPGSHIDFGGLELRLRPFFMPLFTGVRGRGILGNWPRVFFVSALAM